MAKKRDKFENDPLRREQEQRPEGAPGFEKDRVERGLQADPNVSGFSRETFKASSDEEMVLDSTGVVTGPTHHVTSPIEQSNLEAAEQQGEARDDERKETDSQFRGDEPDYQAAARAMDVPPEE